MEAYWAAAKVNFSCKNLHTVRKGLHSRMMIHLEVGVLRNAIQLMHPGVNFDAAFRFYYDETNNIKKFYLKENGFNTTFTANFILGGIVHAGEIPDVKPLIDSFKLQKSATEVKFKQVASGEFLDCLKSEKLGLFLQYMVDSNLYVHYSSLNILYWSLVDIVDSAIAASPVALALGPGFAEHLKNDLYKLCRLEFGHVIDLLYHFEYPNIKKDKIIPFIESLVSLFDGYIHTMEFHFGLESLRQILKEAKKKNDLPFITEDEDYILLKDLSQFYVRPIYTFKHSVHVFDQEDDIMKVLAGYAIKDGQEEIKNYSFTDSKENELVQLSDVFVGLMGKYTQYINTTAADKIMDDLDQLNDKQDENMNLLIDLLLKSENKHAGFFHHIDAHQEKAKFHLICDLQDKL